MLLRRIVGVQEQKRDKYANYGYTRLLLRKGILKTFFPLSLTILGGKTNLGNLMFKTTARTSLVARLFPCKGLCSLPLVFSFGPTRTLRGHVAKNKTVRFSTGNAFSFS